jgi:hypothetical protein
MTLDGKVFYFTSAATIRQLLEVISTRDTSTKGIKKGKKGVKDEITKEIIPRLISMGHFH